MISDTINSSVIYTASTYTDSTTNRTCHSNRFSCIINPCVLSIPLQCYQSSGDIMVSLSPTNQLGSGPITMITIGTNDINVHDEWLQLLMYINLMTS